jgi:hypothetical protein
VKSGGIYTALQSYQPLLTTSSTLNVGTLHCTTALNIDQGANLQNGVNFNNGTIHWNQQGNDGSNFENTSAKTGSNALISSGAVYSSINTALTNYQTKISSSTSLTTGAITATQASTFNAGITLAGSMILNGSPSGNAIDSASLSNQTGKIPTSYVVYTAMQSYQPLLTSSSNITTGSISCSSITNTGDTKITRIRETINNYGAISSNTITTSWTSGNLIYAIPAASSSNLSLVFTNVPTTTNTAFNFSVILDCTNATVYVDSLTLNGSSTTLLYNGGSSSIPTLTSAVAIIQTFNAITTGLGLWKVITNISAYY